MAKARRQKLKVFRTPIGFHDAFVAAPSRKAALDAWGAGTDLFSAGIAEEVKGLSSKAAKAALAAPGEVVRVSRQGGKEDRPSPRPSPARGRGGKKPSRAALERAEKELAALELRQSLERAALDREEAALAKRRRALDEKHGRAREKAEAKRGAAEDSYRARMRDWDG
jgi:hypothetical protein